MNIEELIFDGMDYLERNDLTGFYEYVRGNTKDEADIGVITEVLEKCGIDTINNIGNRVPDAYLCENNFLPDSLINGQVVTFPKGVTVIGESAFYGNKNPALKIIDLRHIQELDRYAFQLTDAETVYFPHPNDIAINTSVFYGTKIKKFLFPINIDMDESELRNWVSHRVDNWDDSASLYIGYY